MTDKSSPSLNLIERMAQRLAKQEAASAKLEMQGSQAPSSTVEKTFKSETVFVRTEPTSSPITSDVRQAAAAVAAPTPAPVAAPMPTRVAALETAPVRKTLSEEKSRQVQLDFRMLRQNGMVTPDNMSSVISNEFRGIKRKLLQKARNPETRATVNNLVMVTSSLPGEGKTFTSMNLAISLAAERGLHVLLIDGDVVRPSVGNMFKSPPRHGLTDLLNGKVPDVSDVLCRCAEIPNLAVMFSGDVHANSPELMSSGQMLNLCKDLSSRYPDRIIVIDTPPVLASPEPATLAAYVHQLIMVVAADQTDRHQLRKALEAVAACENISLLFNKAPKWNESEYKSYYGYASTASTAPAASS